MREREATGRQFEDWVVRVRQETDGEVLQLKHRLEQEKVTLLLVDSIRLSMPRLSAICLSVCLSVFALSITYLSLSSVNLLLVASLSL